MWSDWIYWLSVKHPDELMTFLWALLFLDGPRYALSKILMCLWDCGRGVWTWFLGTPRQTSYTCCPSVCLILAGHNEGENISATLQSAWGSYPRLEIIVVDDGSTDAMGEVARRFARDHSGVLVISRPERGGKASATNWALQHTQAEVILVVDSDSHLGPHAIWEMVQPMRDPQVGAVAGSIVPRNPFTNLATWLQAYEYLSTIFVGRMVSARLGILGIVSGACGAFRRTVLDAIKGWDVGPPEDLDLTLAIRKAGHKIAFAPYAECITDVPDTWGALVRQRRRWEEGGVIRNHCRKHLDMACFWSRNFRLGDFILFVETWFFSVFCTYAILAWVIWFCFFQSSWWQVLVTLYLCYLVFEVIQVLATAYYSTNPRRDLLVCAVFPLVPFYQMFQLPIRLLATTEEILFRKSFRDNYVPRKVREATWHW